MPTLIYISLNSCEIQHLFIYLFICHLDFCFHELIVYIIYSVAYPILLLILSVFYIVIMPILSFILLQVSSTCLWLFFFFPGWFYCLLCVWERKSAAQWIIVIGKAKVTMFAWVYFAHESNKYRSLIVD